MKISLRGSTLVDIPSIQSLMEMYYQEDGYPFDKSLTQHNLSLFIQDTSLGQLLVATAENEIVAYIAVTLGFSFEFGGRDAFIDEVFVKPEWRGQGIGTLCLEAAFAWCQQAQVRKLHLEVEKNKPATYKLYQKLGFIDHNRHLMTKPL